MDGQRTCVICPETSVAIHPEHRFYMTQVNWAVNATIAQAVERLTCIDYWKSAGREFKSPWWLLLAVPVTG